MKEVGKGVPVAQLNYLINNFITQLEMLICLNLLVPVLKRLIDLSLSALTPPSPNRIKKACLKELMFCYLGQCI